MYSDGVTAEDDARTDSPAGTAHVPVELPAPTAAVDSVPYYSNSASVPSYQYDSSGMTELSLTSDEVFHSRL